MSSTKRDKLSATEKRERRADGEGSFIALPDGRYRLKWMAGYKADGRPRVFTVTGRSKSECLQLKQKREKDICKNKSVELGKLTLRDLCFKHLRYDQEQAQKIKSTSVDRREVTIRNQIAPYRIGNRQVCSLTSAELLQHMDMLFYQSGISVSSAEKTYNVINAAFKWANNHGADIPNPCTKVHDDIRATIKSLKKRNENDAVVIVLTPEEEEALIREAKKRDDNGRLIHKIGFSVRRILATGIRVGEEAALTWGDYQNGRLRISKTRHYVRNRNNDEPHIDYYVGETIVKNHHARWIELSKEAVEIMEETRKVSRDTSPEAYVYVNTRGNPSNPSNMDTLINDLYRAAGLPEDISGAHILRRTFATRLYEQGISIKQIAAYMGDEEATVRKYYIATRHQIRENGTTFHYEPFPFIKNNNM